MESMELKTQVGQDGILKVFMPNGMAGKEIRVVMVFEDLKHVSKPRAAVKAEWPEDFFNEVAGSIPDFPDIEYEGDFEQREVFE